MKIKLHVLFITLVLLAGVHQCFAQGTAFTYQGRLNAGGAPANGSYDLAFTLFATNTSGVAIAGPVTNSATGVTNGLFTTLVDFGNVFTGGSNWLAIAVSTNGANSFTPLAPRQQLTPTPYAITAENLAGVLENNTIQSGVSLATISGGGDNVIQSGANNATISGGGYNAIQSGADHSTIGGGSGNNIVTGAYESFVGGGQNNYIYAHWAAIGGGLFNSIFTNADYSFIGGGEQNTIQTNTSFSTIGGGFNNVIQPNATYSAIFGGYGNTLYALYGFIGGGYYNTIQTNAGYSTIGGGFFNVIQTNAICSTIGGGQDNTIQSYATSSTIGGGRNNTIQTNGQQISIGGGYQNTVQANAQNDFIGGGFFNIIQANAYASTIGGGGLNTNGGSYSTIPGGYNNTANGIYSFAAGQQAQATNNGAFVWADSQNAAFSSTANDQFLIRAGGGVGINMNNPNGASLYVQGNRSGLPGNAFGQSVGFFENTSGASGTPGSSPALRVVCDGGSTPNGALSVSANGSGLIAQFGNAGGFVASIANDGTFTCKALVQASDRNAKQNFASLDGKEILAKVISLPVTEWNYKDDATDKKHIGPMAQDFHAAFDLNGADDKHISVVDEGGVALAAIQGLNQKVEAQQAELLQKETEITELKQRLAALEKIVLSQKPN